MLVLIGILWTLFVSVIFSIPTILPVTKDTMNYASVITSSVVILSLIWYFLGGRKHYHGPASNLHTPDTAEQDPPSYDEKDRVETTEKEV